MSYTDTGVGTIIDNNTGLEWEKKSDDELVNDNNTTTFPHDTGNVYTWENAFAVHVAGLNTANFAGVNDWRLPNAKELQSIVNYQFVHPPVSDAFKTPCVAGVTTVLTGSCTATADYWSSTTFADSPTSAWAAAASWAATIRIATTASGRCVAACSLIIGSFDPLII